MKNFVQSGRTVTVPAPAGGALSGDPVLVGSIFGVAAFTAAPGLDVEVQAEGVFDLPKAPAVTFVIGDKVYFDTAAEKVTSVSNGNHLIGSALGNAGGADVTARVRLPGMVVA